MKKTLLIVLMCACVPLHAEVFRCTDADGSIRFTDHPCGDARGLLSFPAGKSADDSSDARMAQTRKLLRALHQDRVDKQENSRREKAEQDRRAGQCRRARDRLASMESAGALYRLDDTGEHVVLNDEQRDQETRQAQQQVAQFCDSK